MKKQDLINHLGLVKHIEGGYFAERYRSCLSIPISQTETRELMSTIYYMLTDDRPIGHFHLNKSDIVHFFHSGSPITYLTIDPNGRLEKWILGPDVTQNHLPQVLVKGGYWKASVLLEGEFGLLSEAVAPGFDYSDMTLGKAEMLKLRFPHLWGEISPYI